MSALQSLATPARWVAWAIHALSRTLAIISIVAMAFLMLAVVYDIFLRETGQAEIRGLVEYAEIALVLTAFFALGETERRRQHVSVYFILDRLQGRAYSMLRITGGVLAALVAILLAVASYDILQDSLARGEFKLGLVRIPMWPARLAVFLGFLILALEQVVTAVEDALHRPDPEEQLIEGGAH